MDRFRNKIQTRVTKCLEELEQNAVLYRESEAQYISYMSKLLDDHSKAITYNDGKASDVYMVSLELYKQHLQDIEQKDLFTLKKHIAEMTRTKTQLIQDLESEEGNELDLIQKREDMWLSVDFTVTSLRKQCVMLSQQIEETKNNYMSLGHQSYTEDEPSVRPSEDNFRGSLE